MLYDFRCPKCTVKRGREAVHEVVRHHTQAGEIFLCPDCYATCERLYTIGTKKEFFSYQDEQYGCEITSGKQEKRLMKSHGHVDARETPQYEKFRSQRNTARRKPVYFTSAGVSAMNRD